MKCSQSSFIPNNTILIKCQLHVNYQFQLNPIPPPRIWTTFPYTNSYQKLFLSDTGERQDSSD